MSLIYQYYVEGENERKLVEVLSKKLSYIRPGRIEVLNLVEKSITYSYTRRLKKNTVVILIFDTDTANIEILEKNIAFLLKCANIKDVVLIPQVCNLEDELLRSCKAQKVGAQILCHYFDLKPESQQALQPPAGDPSCPHQQYLLFT